MSNSQCEREVNRITVEICISLCSYLDSGIRHRRHGIVCIQSQEYSLDIALAIAANARL
jgi:hypothetical protein